MYVSDEENFTLINPLNQQPRVKQIICEEAPREFNLKRLTEMKCSKKKLIDNFQ